MDHFARCPERENRACNTREYPYHNGQPPKTNFDGPQARLAAMLSGIF